MRQSDPGCEGYRSHRGEVSTLEEYSISDVRRGLLQVLATAIAQHNERAEGNIVGKPKKPKTGEHFRPLEIVDLDLRKSKLAPGAKKTYFFHFRISAAPPVDWIELFDRYYSEDKVELGNTVAKCAGSHIVVRAHKDRISAIKEQLDDYVARTNRRYRNSLDRKWKANMQALRQKEELEELRDAMFPRKRR